MTSVPTLQALVLCDAIHRDDGTGKFYLAGTFTHLQSPTFPVVLAKWSLYARILDASGPCEARVRIVNLSSNEALGESGPLALSIEDRVVGREFGFQLPPVGFASPGAYAVELLWGPERLPLGDWRFDVLPIRKR